jgi:hypothetical protein
MIDYEKLKFVICPGYIFNRTDAQRHFISAHQLAALYKVNLNKCIVIHENEINSYQWPEYILLGPSHIGNYSIDNAIEEAKFRYYERQRKNDRL